MGDAMMSWSGRVLFAAVLLSLALAAGAGAQAPSGSAAPQPPAAPAATPAAAATPVPAAVAPAAKMPRYLVYFDEFSAYLSPRSKAIIARAAKEAKKTGAKTITVQARASATGTVQTNKYLAMTRASIVADQLEADGIDPATVQQEPIGQTGSHDPSVFNRRVDIILQH
jgi:outer membrane protein OmpA-like peptidoglycan-associated protein